MDLNSGIFYTMSFFATTISTKNSGVSFFEFRLIKMDPLLEKFSIGSCKEFLGL